MVKQWWFYRDLGEEGGDIDYHKKERGNRQLHLSVRDCICI